MHDANEAARRAGPSATADICRSSEALVFQKNTRLTAVHARRRIEEGMMLKGKCVSKSICTAHNNQESLCAAISRPQINVFSDVA